MKQGYNFMSIFLFSDIIVFLPSSLNINFLILVTCMYEIIIALVLCSIIFTLYKPGTNYHRMDESLIGQLSLQTLVEHFEGIKCLSEAKQPFLNYNRIQILRNFYRQGYFCINGISHYTEFPDRLIRIRIKRTLSHSTQIILCMQNSQTYL